MAFIHALHIQPPLTFMRNLTDIHLLLLASFTRIISLILIYMHRSSKRSIYCKICICVMEHFSISNRTKYRGFLFCHSPVNLCHVPSETYTSIKTYIFSEFSLLLLKYCCDIFPNHISIHSYWMSFYFRTLFYSLQMHLFFTD
eukprot:110062_1